MLKPSAMHINIKCILIGIVVLGCIALFTLGDHIEPGSIFAGLAAFIAAIKSKFLGNLSLKEKIDGIESSHQLKREEWEYEKQKYDRNYEFLKLRMDSLDNLTEILKQELQQTTKTVYKPNQRTEAEIRDWLNKKE
jgi:hypothetical protein